MTKYVRIPPPSHTLSPGVFANEACTICGMELCYHPHEYRSVFENSYFCECGYLETDHEEVLNEVQVSGPALRLRDEF
jgi:hypothetical protein